MSKPPHPLVQQLRFTRAEFLRGVRGVSDHDGAIRLGPMNCLAWNVGHLAWQEQRYFLTRAQGLEPLPEIAETFKVGAPGVTPRLSETLAAWREITRLADPWLDALTTEQLLAHPVLRGKALAPTFGNLLLRTIYHYWYHCGENQAIRQQLGHTGLGQFVGDLDGEAPYVPEGL
jgi:DinB superfamily